MKKIFILLIPMFIILAMIFTIREKNINWISFLNFIESLRFDNAINSFNNAIGNIRNAVNAFGNVNLNGGIIQLLQNIATGLSKWFIAMYYLTKSVFDLIVDIANNLFIITDFLFGSTVRT